MTRTMKRRLRDIALASASLPVAFALGWTSTEELNGYLRSLGILSSSVIQTALYAVFLVAYITVRVLIERGHILEDRSKIYSVYPRFARTAIWIASGSILILPLLVVSRGNLVASLLVAACLISTMYYLFTSTFRGVLPIDAKMNS